MMMIERMSYTSQTNLAYNKTFGKHNINAVLAYEVMKYDYEDMYGEKQVYGLNTLIRRWIMVPNLLILLIQGRKMLWCRMWEA